MTQFKRLYSLLLLLLSMAIALPRHAAYASSSSSSSSSTPPWYSGPPIVKPIFAKIATIDNCTDAQEREIAHVMANNEDILACEANVGSKNLFNLTDPTVLCPDKSCRSGLNTLYYVLPNCKYNVLYAFQYLSGALLRNCGTKPDNATDSLGATIVPAPMTPNNSYFTSGKSRILKAMETLVALGIEV